MKLPRRMEDIIAVCIIVAIAICFFSVVATVFCVFVGGFFLAWLFGCPVEVTKNGVTKKYRWFSEVARG